MAHMNSWIICDDKKKIFCLSDNQLGLNNDDIVLDLLKCTSCGQDFKWDRTKLGNQRISTELEQTRFCQIIYTKL